MKSPHILLASSNCRKLRANLAHLLTGPELARLDQEILGNSASLFALAREHFEFARLHCRGHWRQRTSRLYYAAYACVRAARLAHSGHYSMETNEHQRINQIPEILVGRSEYEVQLPNLREDRNLADYDHSATELDLILSPRDAEELVENLLRDVKAYLQACGATLEEA